MAPLIELLLILATLLTLLYFSKKFLKHSIGRVFGKNGWGNTKNAFFVLASAYLLFSAFHRLYYFHDDIIYGNRKLLNPSYANQIQVETYLMTKQNLIDLFEGKPPNPDKSPFPSVSHTYEYYQQPYSCRYYLVIRIKNQGDQMAWGTLDYFVGDKKTRKIDVQPLSPNMSDFEIIALRANPLDNNQYSNDYDYPNIHSNWSTLFTKKKEGK